MSYPVHCIAPCIPDIHPQRFDFACHIMPLIYGLSSILFLHFSAQTSLVAGFGLISSESSELVYVCPFNTSHALSEQDIHMCIKGNYNFHYETPLVGYYDGNFGLIFFGMFESLCKF